jgi:tetratricopeptide (TPR) repeat protein
VVDARARVRRSAALLALCALPAIATAQGTAPPSAAGDGARAAETAVAAGLVALHNFEYEEANAAFVRARELAPALPLAYWGEALTWHQSLWGAEDVAAGRRALERLPPAAARAAAVVPRTAGLLAAARVLFGEGTATERRQRYASAMATLAAAHPDDPDIAALHALALLGTTTRSLVGGPEAHEGHSPALAGSRVQSEVGGILSRVLARHPAHPGALHYLLHAYDDPAHAHLGVDAAIAYAAAAPDSSHARHMPAHIFLQLGRWAEAEASDRAAYAVSLDWVARKGLGPAMRNFHALSWRQYELLQLGRVAEAATLLDELAPVVTATGDLRLLSDLASMRARQAVESRQWERLGRERNFANVNELCAIGFSAARIGHPALAELARQTLAARASAPEEGALRPAIAIMERQVAAVMAHASGRSAEAVAILRTATRDELALPAPLGLPIPIIPAPELLGEILLEVGQPAAARDAFDQALARTPNRTRSVLGLARAATRLGDAEATRAHYTRVLENYGSADAGLPEIAEARAALTSAPRPAASLVTGPRLTSLTLAFLSLFAIWLAVRQRRAARQPPPTAPASQPARQRRPRKRR